MSEAFGFFNVHKPGGMTSHDVVAKIRRGLRLKKVGHAGTLDPLATGVLVVCVGGATRLSEYVMQSTKRYRARVHLGVITDTYDSEGEVQQTRDASHIEQSDVEPILAQFLGDVQQMPPMYSAIKQGGRKLYDLARAGEVVEREMRAVHIEALQMSDWLPPEFTLDITCSAGTYIRSLAYDIGEALGVGAYMAALTRMSSGTFRLEDAVPLDVLLASEDWATYLIPPQKALAGWPVVYLSAEQVGEIVQGRFVPDEQASEGQMALAFAADERLIAIVRADSGVWKPHKVFSS